MTEIVISTFLAVLFEKLVSPVFEKLARYMGIGSEVKKCKASLVEIRALLDDATQKEITDESIKGWLNRLQHLAYDIDDVLDDLATEAMGRELAVEYGPPTSKVRKLAQSSFTNFSVTTRLHDKLSDITTKLEDLEKEKGTLGLMVLNGRPIIRKRTYETSSLGACNNFVGRECEKETLLKLLLGEACNQNFNIVPIVGMGGIGKTTLARLLFNETQVKDHFELKAWVCVSDEFDVFKISKSIYASVTGICKEFADLNMLQTDLRTQLMGKRFLLVLDDVWTERHEDWDNLVDPFHVGAPGSKIIMTTRKKELLKKLGYNHLSDLQNLSDADALFLFCQHALGVNNFDSHPTLRSHGEGIVKKCRGLPLALKALGRLLRTKTEEDEWKEVLNSKVWRLQKADGIVPALRLSYHDLGACLKQLFAYCSLFPKDYLFDKKELILLWMAEGFLYQATTSMSTMEDLGHEYFEELLSRSFFQHAPNDDALFVMHDLMNDLATSVAGDFFLRLDNEMENDVSKEALEKYRHMSFVCEKFIAYKKFKGLESANNLRTFFAVSVGVKESWQRFYLSDKVLADLLHELPLLRVLSLSRLQISEVPKCIGSLKHLRYLNLCRTKITHLPEDVCNLYNLQTLIVFGCKSLKELPKSFLKLKNLRHFDTRDTPLLKKMPLGIGELKSLRTLTNIIIGGENGFAIIELKDLKYLHGQISIQGLDKVHNAMHAGEANLSQKRLSELELEWGDGFDGSRKETLEKEVLNVLKPHYDNLKKLGIVSYGGIDFPNWVGDPSFVRLSHVSLRGCKKCTSLPSLGQLPLLKGLFIQGMDEVRSVGSELLGTGCAFPSLKTLSFRNMMGWKEWSTIRGVVDAVFPCLVELRINNCPNLVKVSHEALPSLRALEVKGSDHCVLRSLVHVASSITKLEITEIMRVTGHLLGGIIECLGEVEELEIKRCNEIRYLWESQVDACKILVNLRILRICNCSKLVNLGEKEEDNYGSNLTSLGLLRIWDCNSIKHFNCPYSMETLFICDCKSITSIFFPTGERKLKSLYINECEKLLESELKGGGIEMTLMNANMPMLQVVDIYRSPNLKSIIELSYFIHLTSLRIMDCQSMESFPDWELPNLTSLKYLTIANCPSMDASFPRGLWPPKLCFLRIGELKKPVSEWGPQNFPTSLVILKLIGGLSDEMSSCSQLSHLLPSTLLHLKIQKFQKLESVSMGLQHLTSLQHLEIESCSGLKYLPQMLFPSLLSLEICWCPNLEEMCRRGGSYWHPISHIPFIKIGFLKK